MTKVSIYQSDDKVDVIILFSKTTPVLDPEIKEMQVKGLHWDKNRPFSYSAKEPGSSVIFIHFYTRDSIEWRESYYHHCAYSKILQNVAKYRSTEILFQNS